MKGIVIEDNVPVPMAHARKNEGFTALLLSMKPGQSFSMPYTEYQRAHSNIAAFKRRKGGRFTVRKDGDTFRVWCLENAS